MTVRKDLDLISNARVYMISNIVLAMIPFTLLPILTRFLSPESYGKLAMFQLLITGLAAFVSLGLTSSYQRKAFDYNLDRSELALFLGSAIQILIFLSLLMMAMIYILQDYIVPLLGLEVEWVIISVGVIFFTTIVNFRLVNWQVNGYSKRYGLVQITQALLNMLLSIVFIVVLFFDFKGRLSAQIIAPALIALICIVSLKKDNLVNIFNWRPDYIADMLKFGIPLIPHTFGAFIIASADRFFINESLGLKEVGIYMVAVQLASIFNIVFDGINKAFVPWLYAKLTDNNSIELTKIVVKTYLWFVVILSFGLIGSLFVAPTATLIIAGEQYIQATEVIGWLIMGQVLGGMYLMVTNYIFYMKRTDLLGYVTIGSGAINIALLFYLVPLWGLKGAALAYLISMIIRFLMTWLVAARVCPMPWLDFKALKQVKLS